MEPSWDKLDLSELLGRLREAKRLLDEAALVAAAQQAEQVAGLAQLVPDPKEAPRVHSRRRYA